MNLISERKFKNVLISACIALTIWILAYIPVIGAIIKFVSVFAGLGIICKLIFKKGKTENLG